MQGSDNTAESRARLRRTSRTDIRRARIHDFRAIIAELVASVELQDRLLVRHYADELEVAYTNAIDKAK